MATTGGTVTASGHRRDFPFYAGHPVSVSGRGWLLVLLNLNQSTSVVELIRAWISVFTPMVFAVLVELLLSHVSVHPVPLVVNVMAEL